MEMTREEYCLMQYKKFYTGEIKLAILIKCIQDFDRGQPHLERC